MFEESEDYYGEEGCCLTCERQEEGCLCFECKCSKCSWYESFNDEGKCEYPRNYKTWEDYEEDAKRVQNSTRQKYSTEPMNLTAIFSNGTIEKTVHYSYAYDIPHKILSQLENGKWRSLLLKRVFQGLPEVIPNG